LSNFEGLRPVAGSGASASVSHTNRQVEKMDAFTELKADEKIAENENISQHISGRMRKLKSTLFNLELLLSALSGYSATPSPDQSQNRASLILKTEAS
jgi:hypothetical protein